MINKVKENKIPCLLVTHDEADKKISHEKDWNFVNNGDFVKVDFHNLPNLKWCSKAFETT